ncbi:MAG: SGNH/GDSL hydrolase family protein [Gemmataceae bacterium]
MRSVAALLLLAFHTATAAEPVLQKGERIVFFGDSITFFGDLPRGYVSTIRAALAERHKDEGIEVRGAGIPGNKVSDLQRRLDKDVLAKKPTLVVIYIGINDVWHNEKILLKGTPKDKFEAGLKDIIQRIQTAGSRVVLCTPSVIGEKKPGTNKLDAQLDEYADISREVAKRMNVPLVDLRKAFQEHLMKNNPDDKERGILTLDRAHLNDAGNKLVAATILKTLDP